MPDGDQRQVHAHLRQLGLGPRPGGYHRGGSLDAALRGVHGANSPALDFDARGLQAEVYLGAQVAGGVGVGRRYQVGVGVARLRLPAHGLVLGDRDHRGDVAQVGGGDDHGVYAQPVLHGAVVLQAGAVFFLDHHQVAGLGESRRPADDVLEVGEYAQAFPGHGGRYGVGVVHPADGLAAAGGAAVEDVLLQQHGVGDAQPG